jgi:hypothetical protein
MGKASKLSVIVVLAVLAVFLGTVFYVLANVASAAQSENVPMDLPLLMKTTAFGLWGGIVGGLVILMARFLFPIAMAQWAILVRNRLTRFPAFMPWWFFAAAAAFFVLMALLQVSMGHWSFAVYFGCFAALELGCMGLALARPIVSKAGKDDRYPDIEDNGP